MKIGLALLIVLIVTLCGSLGVCVAAFHLWNTGNHGVSVVAFFTGSFWIGMINFQILELTRAE